MGYPFVGEIICCLINSGKNGLADSNSPQSITDSALIGVYYLCRNVMSAKGSAACPNEHL